MYKSILLGLIYPLTIFLSGWIRQILLFISFKLIGNRIPILYLFLGIDFGRGEVFRNEIPFWPGYIFGLIFSIAITYFSTSDYLKSRENYSTFSTCGSGFIFGSLIGLVIRFF